MIAFALLIQESEGRRPSVTEEHLLLQLAAQIEKARPGAISDRHFMDNR
jgi:hypothetical protein